MLNEFWTLQAPVQAALITGSATCLAALIGFTAVFIQIGRQGRNAIKANTQNEKLKRKVEIYEKTLKITQGAQEAIQSLTSYLGKIETSFMLARVFEGERRIVPAERYPEYSDRRSAALDAVIELVFLIESWLIIEPKLDVFRLAIGLGLDEHRKVAFAGGDPLIYALPVDGFAWEMPTEERLVSIESRIQAERYQVERLSAWIGDFKVEMQLLLLGELFPNAVERRDPPDPDQFCIRLDKYDQIVGILDATDWRKRSNELEAEAWARFADKNVGAGRHDNASPRP
ncbi:hypothetical protein AB4Z13_14305 [Rhizobium sp. YAF28]|uniref:hypothetical protein n=1 Tax=Rhizobium sp. YAF28 TaxID=3233081 RepID=UPI003F956FE0